MTPRLLVVPLGLLVLLLDGALGGPAVAIPAFARRHEVTCGTCHAFHYPMLNAFGRRFRENGYQLPGGAEDAARARRTVEPGTSASSATIFREVPLSVRGQAFGIGRPLVEGDASPFDAKVFAYLMGGGSLTRDVSFLFSWTPYPAPQLHHAKIGLHNLGERWLGEGALNVRAGALMLLDFQRPTHRALSPGPASATGVAVGENRFTLDDPNLGVELYGRPGQGPLLYQLALLSGDPGTTGADRDRWKDGFARLAYTLFQDTSHELTLGAFGYLGRSEIETTLGGLVLVHRDDFHLVGGDAHLELGPFDLFVMGYQRGDGDPLPSGGSVGLWGVRGEVLWAPMSFLTVGARYDQTSSHDDATLARQGVAGHVTHALDGNVFATLEWRQDLASVHASSVVLALDVAF